MKKFLYIFFIFFFSPLSPSTNDPFKKITVTSQNATFQKDKKNKSTIYLQYSDKVHVKFADSSTVSSDKLEIFVEKGDAKKIVFKNNVRMNRNNQKVRADLVEVLVGEKRCDLRGNVRVEQVKKKENDVPIVTECAHARLKWEDEEVELVGSDKSPVSTTIQLGGRLRVLQKKNKKKTT